MALVADDAGKAGEHVDKERAANGRARLRRNFPASHQGVHGVAVPLDGTMKMCTKTQKAGWACPFVLGVLDEEETKAHFIWEERRNIGSCTCGLTTINVWWLRQQLLPMPFGAACDRLMLALMRSRCTNLSKNLLMQRRECRLRDVCGAEVGSRTQDRV